MNSDLLLREIRSAFDSVPRPKRTMADAEVDDDGDERSRFDEHDEHWWEIPDDLLERCSAPFCFLSTEDFLYYLPAYMSWVVRMTEPTEGVSDEWLIYYLENPERGGRLISHLDSSQVSVVRHFLEWVLSTPIMHWAHNNANAALEHIWSGSARHKRRPPAQ